MKLDRNRTHGTIFGTGRANGARYMQDGEYFNAKGEHLPRNGKQVLDPPPPAPKPDPEPKATDPAPDVVTQNWRDLHWTKQVKLAEELLGEDIPQSGGLDRAREILTERLG